MIKKIFMTALLLTSILLMAETDTFFKEVDARGIHNVTVENVNGEIEITTWDRDLVQVNATITGTEKDLKNIEIKVETTGNRLDIETEHGKRMLWGVIPMKTGGKVDYSLKLPLAMNVEVESVNGGINVTGLKGNVEFSTVNGNLNALDVEGEVRAESINGSIDVELTSPRPSCRVETINGSVKLAIPEDASAKYAFETINGKITFEPKDIEVRGSGPKDIAGTLGGGAGKLHVEVINGSIAVDYIRSTR